MDDTMAYINGEAPMIIPNNVENEITNIILTFTKVLSMNNLFYLLSLCRIDNMKSTLLAVTLIGCMCLSVVLIGQLDPTYQTVKHSKESSQHLGNIGDISPDTGQFNVMLDNHLEEFPCIFKIRRCILPISKVTYHIKLR